MAWRVPRRPRAELKARRHAPLLTGAAGPQAAAAAPAGDRDHPRPGGPGRVAGAGADPRGGLSAVRLRLPSWTPRPGRHRGDPLPGRPLLRVGAGGGHHRPASTSCPCRHHGPGAAADRRQARPGAGQGVLEGGILAEDGGMRKTTTGAPQADSLTAAQQPGPVRAGRAFARAWRGNGDRVPAPRSAPAGRGHLAAGPLRGRLRRHGGRHPRPRRRSPTRSRRCWRAWACACRRPRQHPPHRRGRRFLGWRIQRHQQREATDATSTPTASKKALRPSRRRCGR